MRNEVQQQSLKDIQVLEITNGPSGGYAGRLLAESGAHVQKLLQDGKEVTRFRDAKKKIIFSDLDEVKGSLYEKWDLIIWDSHCSEELDRSLCSHFEKEDLDHVGVRICFPAGIGLDEEDDLQAWGGWMELTGDPEKDPLRVGGFPAAYLIGAHTATGGLLALLEKKSTGCGRLVEISAPAILVGALEGTYSKYMESGMVRTRAGNRHNKLTPMAILPASDGWGFVGAPVDEQWTLLERWADLPHVPQWTEAEERFRQKEKVEAMLADWTKKKNREELFLTGQAFRLPFASVQSLEDVRVCPHLKARDVWTANNMKLPWKMTEKAGASASRHMNKPLNKLRILDLTGMWSGPYCTRLFADLGAEVIKIEAPHRPDGIRPVKGAANPFFSELNRNKLGITLNLQRSEDKEIFLGLVKESDVLVENFSPRVMGNFGLHDEKLWEYRPELVIASLSAFGQSGPYRDFVGYGPTIECMSGISYMTHYEDGSPWLPGFSVSDAGAGIHGAFAIAAALHHRQNKGTGMKVDLSQYEVACQFTADFILDDRKKSKPSWKKEVKGLSDFFERERMNIPTVGGVSPSLGPPWKSEGWKPNDGPPPEFGRHKEVILRSLQRTNQSEKEALYHEI